MLVFWGCWGSFLTPTYGLTKKLTKEDMLSVMEESRGNRSAAARLPGCSRSTLYRKIEEFGIGDT
ncbi:MAG: helix-turn-helix domain-containing protein [Desulfococcaceae bacterium]|jgi:transcriptional regulator of acetoin/glycerol metabolism|nr:helix-turn-helix domain-containing protein [Desulfococcaceae bacterium]